MPLPVSRNRCAIAILLSWPLAGCEMVAGVAYNAAFYPWDTTDSVSEMIEKADYETEFLVSEPYQDVTSRIRNETSRCLGTHEWQQKNMDEKLRVLDDGEVHYGDRQRDPARQGLDLEFIALLFPVGEGNTRVEIYAYNRALVRAGWFEDFLASGTPLCE